MKSFIYGLLLVLVVGLVYGLTLRGSWGNPNVDDILTKQNVSGAAFESSLARGRFAHVLALGEDGSFDLRNGKELIPMPDLGFYDGRFYALFAPGLAIYSLPAYLLGRELGASQLFVYGFLATIAVLDGLLIFALARKIGAKRWAAWFAGLSYTLATTAWPYAVTMAQHNTTVLFLLLILWSGLKARESGWAYFLGWAAFGLAWFIDYPNVILLLPGVVFMAFSAVDVKKLVTKYKVKLRLALAWGVLGFLLVGVGHGYYNKINFGSPWHIGTSVYTRAKTVEDVENLVNGIEESKSEAGNPAAGLFDAKRLPNGLYVLTVSRGRGVVVYAPIVLLGLWGIAKLAKRDDKLAFGMLASVVVNLMLYAAFGDPWGGWEFGPRYLIPSMAILSLGLAILLTEKNSIWIRLVAWVLFGYSLIVNWSGVLTTNQLPAEVEALYHGMPFTFLHNLRLFAGGMVSSFVYKNWLGEFTPSWVFGGGILIFVLSVATINLWALPILEKGNDE